MTSILFRLVLVIGCLSTPSSASNARQIDNPVQVRFDEFSIEVGPTNNGRPLGQKDADYILGLLEDLIFNYFENHYDTSTTNGVDNEVLRDGSNDEHEGLLFKSAFLGLVSIPVDPEQGRTEKSILDFSGGVAYFEGSTRDGTGPSTAEVQLLVSLALNESDLLEALQAEYPYIREAKYIRGSLLDQDHGDPTTDAVSDALMSSPILDSPLAINSEVDSQNQFIIILVSACVAAVVFSVLLALGFVVRQKQRSAFWREDVHRTTTNSNDKPSEVIDAALEDLSLGDGYVESPSKKRSARDAKQQSLHLRDSLRDGGNTQEDALSDTGSSSRLGRLLTSAATSLGTKLSCGDDSEIEKQSGTDQNVITSGDPDTSSCSHDSSHSNESVHGKDFDTCPSDFEGNAFVKPNVVPVIDLERFNNDDPRNPLPQSQIDAATLTKNGSLASIDLDDTSSRGQSKFRTKQEGFLAKYVHPITGSILPLGSAGLSYFGHSTQTDDDEDDGNLADCETPDKPNKQTLTPQTVITAGDHWSDVSSEYRTDDDFEMDRAWDPDDTSIGSEIGKEIFSPRAGYNDEVSLLESLGSQQDRYNLNKLRTPPKTRPPLGRRLQNVMDTAEV